MTPPEPANEDHAPASFAEMAALEFEPEALNLSDLPSAEQLNNPFMVSVRIAAVSLTKSKVELVEMVRGLDGDTPDGGDFWMMIQGLQNAQGMFQHLSGVLERAEARLLCAASTVAVEDGIADPQ